MLVFAHPSGATCHDPLPPMKGSFGHYTSTVEGSVVVFYCNEGLIPVVGQINTTCASNGSLTPNPAELICNERPSDGEGQLSLGSHKSVCIAAFILLRLEVIAMYVFMLLIFKMVFVGHDFHISFQKAIGVVCNSACSAAEYRMQVL